MTDQFTYLNHRMQHLESRVSMLEQVVRPESDGNGEPPDSSPEAGQTVRDGDTRMIEAVLWSIYEFVTSQSIGHSNDYKDVVEIKDSQISAGRRLESIEQAVSEVRGGVETIVGLLSKQS